MSHDPTARLVAALEARGFEPRPTGHESWESRCPSHNGTRHNLSVKRGDDGRVLVKCHHSEACSHRAVAEALGLAEADLFPPRDADRPRKPSANGHAAGNGKPRRAHPTPEAALAGAIREYGEPTGHHVYHDDSDRESFRVYRFDFDDTKTGEPGKSYRPVHTTPEGWIAGDPPGLLPLYQLLALAGAHRVYVGEGEKVADLLLHLGLDATTSAHGSNAAHKTDWTPLAGKEVVHLPDHDGPGEGYRAAVLDALGKLEPRPTAKVVRLPDMWRTSEPMPEGGDVADWLLDGVPEAWEEERCRAELERLADGAAPIDLAATRVEAVEDDPWPAPRLGEMPEAEPFPVDVLPAPVADFAGAVAGSIGCPVDFAGLPILVVAGAANGRAASLLLKPGYFAPTALYGLNVADPSGGKTPALAAVVDPLWHIDRALHEEYLGQRAEFEEALRRYEAHKGPGKPPRPVKPAIRSAVLDDCTVEAVARHVALNPRGLLVARDEGSAWFAGFNQYKGGKGADRQFWLSLLFGKPIRIDRKGHEDLVPLRIAHPFGAVVGNIPPSMLSELREQRGRDDGFTERILFAYPDPMPRPHWSDDGIPDEAARDWAGVVGRLRARPLAQSEAGDHPNVVRFSAPAKAAWVEWYNGHVDEVNGDGYDSGELAADGKLCDFAARLALILHLLDLAADPTRGDADPIPDLTRSAVERAVRLWSYFRSHHRRVRWSMSGGSGNPDGRDLLGWIRRGGRDSFTVADATTGLRRFKGRPDVLADALAWLVRRDVIRPRPEPERPRGTKGRKPSPAYEVNPHALSRNSGNSFY